MYTVFVNEKPLIFSDKPSKNGKNIHYENEYHFNEAVAYLFHSNSNQITIFHHNLKKLWKKFNKHFKNIVAAGGVVSNKNNEILFIQRFGKWDLPKGKQEGKETFQETAVREVEEECGISNLDLKDFITTTYHIYKDKKYIFKITHWYDVFYAGNQEPKGQKEEGIERVKWQSFSKTDELLKDSYENIRMLFKEYKKMKN